MKAGIAEKGEVKKELNEEKKNIEEELKEEKKKVDEEFKEEKKKIDEELKEEKKKIDEELKEEKKKIQEKVDNDKGDDGKVEEGKENVEEYEDESEKFYINWAELGKVSPVKPLTNPCALSWAQAASLVLESKIAI